MKPRSCWREDGRHKMTFSSRKLAKAEQRKGQHVYLCENCTNWHIASDH